MKNNLKLKIYIIYKILVNHLKNKVKQKSYKEFLKIKKQTLKISE